ncbi:uncharacterized protein LOC122618044 [Drosophila teissieri]|uniref:uncharacterized protein LOC122618044 n=1 Tax=Drosophila teissieri TaxID=7243 RepID=UPI001CBA5159|nr:uncharacterized protein LOC122618044 [Drosophila teissieri]
MPRLLSCPPPVQMPRHKPASVVLTLLLVVLLTLIHHRRTDARFVPSPPAIPSICKKPPPRSEGVCAIDIEGFYYDPITFDCKMYKIGACHLIRGQSFGSQQDCVSTCIHGIRRNHDFYVNE